MEMKKKNLCHALSPSEENVTQITALYFLVSSPESLTRTVYYIRKKRAKLIINL